MDRIRNAGRWLPLFLLASLQPLLWKLRIHDPARQNADGELTFGVVDHYLEQQPMLSLAARRVAAGDFPLWNPFELCGVPFLAGMQGGLLYPPNVLFLMFEAPLASELTLIAHLAFAALCVYGLARTWDAPPIAALAAGLSFAWCGRINTIVNQQAPLLVLTWMPLTVWLVELTLRRKRHAAVGLALAVCAQILVGAVEVVVFNLQAAGLYALFRLTPRLLGKDRGGSVRSAVVLLAAVVLGIALAGPLLLPVTELIARSGRLTVSLDEARVIGTIPLADLAAMLISNVSRLEMDWVHVHAGVLSLLAVALGLGMRSYRPLYLYAIALCAIGALVTEGGPFFELYFSTPIGANLRRPWKFLAFLALGMALLTAIGVARLDAWAKQGERPSFRHPTWAATFALCLVLGGFAAADGVVVPYGIAAAGLLILAAVQRPTVRRSIVLGLVALHAVQLFMAFENKGARALHRPESLYRESNLWRELSTRAGYDRILISGRLWFDPAFVPKQGSLHGFYATTGYDALTSREHTYFFNATGVKPMIGDRFFGASGLTADVDWALMDHTSTRFVVLHRDENLARRLTRKRFRKRLGFRRVTLAKPTRAVVYERASALPRARFSADYRLVPDPEAAISALTELPPESEAIVLEASPAEISRPSSTQGTGRVEIKALEAERVVLEVDASEPGFVVLSDSWYPGWQARVDGRDVPIFRADVMFRAVAVPAGHSLVEFDFRPRSFVLGGLVAAVAAALLGVLFVLERRDTSKDAMR